MHPKPSPTSPHLPRWLCVAIAALCLATPALAQPKIGTVDFDKVFNGYFRTKQAFAQLKERAAGFEEDRKTMLKDLEKAREDWNKAVEASNEPALSTDEREKRKGIAEKRLLDVRQIEQEIRQFISTFETTIGEQRRRLTERILDEIREVVAAKAKASGLTLVLDASGRSVVGAPIVLYHSGENDLSDAVLAELNSRTPVELPSDKTPATPKADSTPPNAK